MGGKDIYENDIMELARAGSRPRYIDAPDGTATLDNPLCGDRVTIEMRRDKEGKIADIGHDVRGCALCQASAVALADTARGKSPVEINAALSVLQKMLKDDHEHHEKAWPTLAAFRSVHGHKSRYECVLLPFRALLVAISEGEGGDASRP
ncbi:MAG: iron-sulfur cluster assembly scaffold protein [Rhodospirillales bacterium]|nr:iron-sulfur cluster assembly scaffold protein [Rhodospirillales bacterium]MCW9039110.1 iron-sulfur cluster assembly scaffold protein [Rhodospirillales bacterium]